MFVCNLLLCFYISPISDYPTHFRLNKIELFSVYKPEHNQAMPSQSDPNPMSTTTAAPPISTRSELFTENDARDDASDPIVVRLGASEPVEAWTQEKRRALAAGIAEKLGVDPGAITITVTEP